MLNKPWLRRLCAMKKSRWACAINLGLSFLSLGINGYLLYWLAWPLLWPWYPSDKDWHGDWVWAAVVGIGMVWSLLFLVAGYLNQLLLEHGTAPWLRRVLYFAILWLGAAILWFGTLRSNVT